MKEKESGRGGKASRDSVTFLHRETSPIPLEKKVTWEETFDKKERFWRGKGGGAREKIDRGCLEGHPARQKT